MKTHEAITRARALLDALDQQLTAASSAEAEDARERVAVLSFGLTALLEQLGAQTPDNDVAPASAPESRPVLHMYERYPAGPGRELVVVRCFARWFVAEGFVSASYDTWRVAGPFGVAREAHLCARTRSAECMGWPAQRVVEA